MNLKMNNQDTRLMEAAAWLDGVLGEKYTLRQIAGDASFRRFFRVRIADKTYILVDAPPDKNENEAFVRINQLFKKIRTPEIYAVNRADGFFLEEDFGDETFFLKMKSKIDLGLYRKAIDSLVELQTISQPGILPEYSRETMELEMNRFREWYRGKYLQKSFSDEEENVWQKMVSLIVGRILAQRKVYVFRDYHSRNMMILKDGELGMLDYQDALYGPVAYDLVSLLKDAYLKLTPEQIEELLAYYQRYSGEFRPRGEFVKDFDYTGLQRHLKVLGIFARLSLRDGKHEYLKDVPLVRKYILDVIDKYDELLPLAKLLAK